MRVVRARRVVALMVLLGLSIFDVKDAESPQLVSTTVTPRSIHGELLSTNDVVLLLNDPYATHTLDVWDVEDATNPVLAASLVGIGDEHVSCVLDCAWAYGSDGSIIDLRRHHAPVVRNENWKDMLGIGGGMHRVDELRNGYVVTAPTWKTTPRVIDVRKPLQPRIIARTKHVGRPVFLHSQWPNGGRHRYLFSSVETSESSDCDGENEGALLTFDTNGWPERRKFPLADRFKIEAQAGSTCVGYYFDFHPDFDETGLLILPYGRAGTRVIRANDRGKLSEVGFFEVPTADTWLAFWVSDDIFYSLNTTGEVFILRYRD